MNFFLFVRYFDSVDICKIRSDWRETRIQGTFPANAREVFKMVKLTVFYTSEVEVGVFQEGVRLVDDCFLLQKLADISCKNWRTLKDLGRNYVLKCPA